MERPTYSQIQTRYEAAYELHWCPMNPSPRPCFNTTRLVELCDLHRSLKRRVGRPDAPPIRYQALVSALPGVYKLDGGLEPEAARRGIRLYSGLP